MVFVLFLSWDLEYTGLVTNFGPVPFVPWGTSRESRGEVKTIHNEKAPTFPEKEEVGVKDAVMVKYFAFKTFLFVYRYQGSHFSGLTKFPDFSSIFSIFPVFF